MNFSHEIDEKNEWILIASAFEDEEDSSPFSPDEEAEIEAELDEMSFNERLSDFQVTAGILGAFKQRDAGPA